MNTQTRDSILRATGSDTIVQTQLIQDLWSGYGKIYRCRLSGGSTGSVVVKHVQLPKTHDHPRGWNTNRSFERKKQSYLVEISWYSGLARQTSHESKLPQLFHHEANNDEILMIMEDLDDAGFPIRKTHVNDKEIRVCLDWLANFHAQYMQVRDNDLWEIGTYWHLATRPDELNAMQDDELKKAASKIDQMLNTAQHQTLVHGDAKLANFCFSGDGISVAAVDFQYIGHGCGMKDVAYFLSSCLNEEQLNDTEETYLSYYFDSLSSKIQKHNSALDVQKIIEEWDYLYPFAWTDFYRFLDGWSPGHWKMNNYSEAMKNKVLNILQ